MPRLDDLNASVQGILGYMDAFDQGDTARADQLFNQTLQTLKGLQTAATTRATIGTEMRAKAEHPLQMRQQVVRAETGEIGLENLKTTMAYLQQQLGKETTPEGIKQLTDAMANLVNLQQQRTELERGVGRARGVAAGAEAGAVQAEAVERRARAVTGVAMEPGRRRVVSAQQRAQEQEAIFSQRVSSLKNVLGVPDLLVSEMLETIPMESDVLQAKIDQISAQHKAATTAAAKFAAEQAAMKVIEDEMRKQGQDPAVIAFYKYMIDAKLEPSEEHFVSQINLLTRTKAQIKVGASLEQAMNEAATAIGQETGTTFSPDRVRAAFGGAIEAWGRGAGAVVATEADKNEAIRILDRQILALQGRMAGRPKGIFQAPTARDFTKGEPAPGEPKGKIMTEEEIDKQIDSYFKGKK